MLATRADERGLTCARRAFKASSLCSLIWSGGGLIGSAGSLGCDGAGGGELKRCERLPRPRVVKRPATMSATTASCLLSPVGRAHLLTSLRRPESSRLVIPLGPDHDSDVAVLSFLRGRMSGGHDRGPHLGLDFLVMLTSRLCRFPVMDEPAA